MSSILDSLFFSLLLSQVFDKVERLYIKFLLLEISLRDLCFVFSLCYS